MQRLLVEGDEFFFDILSDDAVPVNLLQTQFADEHTQQDNVHHTRVAQLARLCLPIQLDQLASPLSDQLFSIGGVLILAQLDALTDWLALPFYKRIAKKPPF